MFDEAWITVYKDDVYNFQISMHDGFPCAHTKVHGKVTSSNFKVYKQAFKEACYYLDAMGFGFLMSITPNVKFVKMIVGDYLQIHGKFLDSDVVYINLEDYLYGDIRRR